MVNYVEIYGFCLFKKKNVGEADVSVYINMYGLKRKWVAGKKFQKKSRKHPETTLIYRFEYGLSGSQRL